MSLSPSHLLLGAAIVVVFVFFLRRLRLLLQLTLGVGRLAAIVFVVILVGWAIGLWRFPEPVERFLFGLPQPWRPVQAAVAEWLASLFQ